MPGLLNLIRNMRKIDKEPRVLILGLDNAGKTTVLRKLSEEDTTNISPTPGFNVKQLNCSGFRITLWDIGGQKTIRQYWDQYLDNTDVLIYVVDSSDKKRLDESASELTTLLENEKLAKVPILVMANKQDLDCALPADEVATTLNLHYFTQRVWRIHPCSAKTGDGLQEGMEWAIKTVASS